MTTESRPMSPRRRRALAAAAAFSLIALVAAAAWIFWRSEISVGSQFDPRSATDGGAQVATTQFAEAANWTSASGEVSLNFDSTEYGPGWEATAPLRVRVDPALESAEPGRVVGLDVDAQEGPNADGLSYEVYAINAYANSADTDCSTYDKTLVGGAGSLTSTEFSGDVPFGGSQAGVQEAARLCITVKANENLVPAEGPTTVSWTVVSESR